MRSSPFLHAGFSGPCLTAGGGATTGISEWMKVLWAYSDQGTGDFDEAWAYTWGGNELVIEEICPDVTVVGTFARAWTDRAACFWRLFTFQQSVGTPAALGVAASAALDGGGRLVAQGGFGGGPIQTRIPIDEGLRLACAAYWRPPASAGTDVYLMGTVNVKMRQHIGGVDAEDAGKEPGET